MAVLPTIDVTIPQLCLDIKASRSPITFFNVQALLAIPYRSATHAISISMLLAGTVLYPIGEFSKNL